MKALIVTLMVLFTIPLYAVDNVLTFSCNTNDKILSGELETYGNAVDYRDQYVNEIYLTGGELDLPGSIDTIKREYNNSKTSFEISYNVTHRVFLPIHKEIPIGKYQEKLDIFINKISGQGTYVYLTKDPNRKNKNILLELAHCKFN